jgi:hypothetical protein
MELNIPVVSAYVQYIYCTMKQPSRPPTATTPFFPVWRARLGPLKAKVQDLRRQPLPYLQGLFGSWIPAPALAPATDGPNSRDRIFNLHLTFWAFLSQVLNPATACREAVRQVLALFCLQALDPMDEQTSAYCQARLRLPLDRLQQILGKIAQHARQRCPKTSLWLGREVKVVDGSSVTLPDTPANQKVFPQPPSQKPGCGFPILRFVGLFSLTTGCVLATVTGSYYDAELTLFRKLWHFLKPRDILVADRLFSDYGTLACLGGKGVDVVVRMNQFRPKDFRQGRYLGPQDRLVTWRKPPRRPRTIGAVLWLTLPAELTLRMFRVRCSAKGFRTRHLIVVTTLLDPEKYPAAEVAKLYLQRWSVELFFRDLKTLLQMEHLRCKSPMMVQKEFLMHLIGYNLIRAVMVETVRKHAVPLERLSFKGSLDSVRQFSLALAKARKKKQLADLVRELLRVLATDLVPHRPNRKEPRALKRRPKPFPRLTQPRHQFKEIPHRSKYRKNKTQPK